LEKLDPPVLPAPETVPAETLARPESIPSEPAPSNADQGPVSLEIAPGPPSEGSREQPPDTSSPGSEGPDLSTPAARRRFVDEFKAECKRLAKHNVYMGDLALIAGHTTPTRRFAPYEWIRRGGKGNLYQMLVRGPAKAVESLNSLRFQRIRAMPRSAKEAPKV
jgi:hypothetical protein